MLTRITRSRMFGEVRPITTVKMHGPDWFAFESEELHNGEKFMMLRGAGKTAECAADILTEEGFMKIAGLGDLTPTVRAIVVAGMVEAAGKKRCGSGGEWR